MNRKFDVVIVGGSYAGLSAAMTLGRAIREVLVVDSGKPCNRHTPHSHNFLTQDGKTPVEISVLGREQVMAYPTIEIRTGRVSQVTGVNHNFQVMIDDREIVEAKKVLFATGVKDLMPEISSFDDCWGISVIHCPYCHGYEFRDRRTGILVNGDKAFEFGRLIHNWTKELFVFTDGPSVINAEDMKKLSDLNIQIVEKKIKGFEHVKGYLHSVAFVDGSRLVLDVMYARVPFEQHCEIPELMGCVIGATGYIEVDELQKTSVAGIYAAGDNTTMGRAVSTAVAAGTRAGAAINHELLAGN
eukprot:gene17423-20863_t